MSQLLSLSAQANIGPNWFGEFAAEPSGLKGVAIFQEKLTIDLRPLRNQLPVQVKVSYQLDNPGTTKKLNLLFISGTVGVDEFEVRLNDEQVGCRPVPQEELSKLWKQIPDTWKPPRCMPGIDKAEVYARICDWSDLTLLAFAIELPAGTHFLTVRYQAKAAGTDEGYPTATWQFPYILSPAREWGSFSGLDVTVYIPEGWQSTSTLPLEREGNLLHGSFSVLPADNLIVATRAPVGPELQRATYLFGGVIVLCVVGGGALCWWLGRALGSFLSRPNLPGHRGRSRYDPRILLLALGSGLLWAALVYGSCIGARAGIYSVLAGQESPYFHESFFFLFCGTFLMLLVTPPLGFMITWRSACNLIQRLETAKNAGAS